MVIDLVGQTHVKCHGDNTGSIQISVSGSNQKQVAPGCTNTTIVGPDLMDLPALPKILAV